MNAETLQEERFNVSNTKENAERLAKNARRNGKATRITKEVLS